MAITQLAGLRCIFDEDFLDTELDNLLLSCPFLPAARFFSPSL